MLTFLEFSEQMQQQVQAPQQGMPTQQPVAGGRDPQRAARDFVEEKDYLVGRMGEQSDAIKKIRGQIGEGKNSALENLFGVLMQRYNTIRNQWGYNFIPKEGNEYIKILNELIQATKAFQQDPQIQPFLKLSLSAMATNQLITRSETLLGMIKNFGK